MNDIDLIVQQQKKFFSTQSGASIDSRKASLRKLKSIILNSEERIFSALEKDLGKPKFESYLSEVNYIIQEIDLICKNLDKWTRPKKVKTPVVSQPGKSYIYSEPYGVALIIGAWNYPFQLALSPALGAIAAGNSVIIKPSEISSYTSTLLAELINPNFPKEHLHVVEGGVEETQQLLANKLDYIFYTGNSTVGKIIMKAAAENLTPVTLELGGKSPCLVFGENDYDLIAKRIVWGKLFNTGQTCVAPDYLVTTPADRPKIEKALISTIKSFYTDTPLDNEDYGKVINERHFKRIKKLLSTDRIIFGGQCKEEECKIAPTLIAANFDSPIMQEEIFGPILPIIEVENIHKAIQYIKNNDKPLALYLFTKDKNVEAQVLNTVSFGGGCVNDTIVHLASDELPFGGVGNSGMGSYHGKYSFDTFSHKKSVLIRPQRLDMPLRYPPYSGKLEQIRKLFKWI